MACVLSWWLWLGVAPQTCLILSDLRNRAGLNLQSPIRIKQKLIEYIMLDYFFLKKTNDLIG